MGLLSLGIIFILFSQLIIVCFIATVLFKPNFKDMVLVSKFETISDDDFMTYYFVYQDKLGHPTMRRVDSTIYHNTKTELEKVGEEYEQNY